MGKKVKRRFPVYRDKDNVIWIKCLKCGEVWYPNANKWEFDGEDRGKTLRCVKCRYRNRLAPALVKMLRKQAETYVEWGIGKIKK